MSDEQKSNLTEVEEKELNDLYAKESPTIEEIARVEELEKKSSAEIVDVISEDDENDNQEENEETTDTEVISNTQEPVKEEIKVHTPEGADIENLITFDPIDEANHEKVIQRFYIVEKVEPKSNWNQLWGSYESESSCGLGCITKCFAIDLNRQLKVGDTIELPESVTIRQSHRKIKPDDKNTKPSIFDWLQF